MVEVIYKASKKIVTMVWGMAQVDECLPNMHDAVGSIPAPHELGIAAHAYHLCM